MSQKFYRAEDVARLLEALEYYCSLELEEAGEAFRTLGAFAKVSPVSMPEFDPDVLYAAWDYIKTVPYEGQIQAEESFQAGTKWENERIRKLMERK